jgi:glycine hydroxymethyltransferase
MIPSENYTSRAVLDAVGSLLSNKYSEGYPEKRYYQGNEFIDKIEQLAIKRAKKIFDVPHVNVQPYSGSPANTAVLFALVKPSNKIMGMALSFGGHLTHGHPTVTLSGKYFKSIQYTVDKNTEQIDFDEVEKLAKKHKPKLIISGTSAYPRKVDFKRFGEIADKVGAYHLADISHIAGLVAAGKHQSPVRYAHIITTTTHKTLKGPRGAIIMVTKKGLRKDPDLAKKIDRAVFPGLQGGPHNNTTAGIAVAMKEAQSKSFKKYAEQMVSNAKALAKELKKYGFRLISGGTDTHLLLIDITNKGIDGWTAAWALDHAGIVVNRNTIPFDKRSPYYPSGIRVGTPAVTTRGMGIGEMKKIAKWINQVIEIASAQTSLDMTKKERRLFKNKMKKDKNLLKIAKEVRKLCRKFPVPSV